MFPLKWHAHFIFQMFAKYTSLNNQSLPVILWRVFHEKKKAATSVHYSN